MVQQATEVRPGDYFYHSWGYDQANIDYLVVVSVSPTGKTAICKMAKSIYVGSQSQGSQDMIMPGEAYGEPFRLKVDNGAGGLRLRGPYPYTKWGDKMFGSFWPTKIGETHYQTNPMFGH